MSKRGSVQIVMDYLSILEKEPESSREAVSFSVRYLLVRERMSLAELADYIGIGQDYLPRKIDEGRWKFDELDIIADRFELHPGDLLHGPKYIRNLESKAQGDRNQDHADKEREHGEVRSD